MAKKANGNKKPTHIRFDGPTRSKKHSKRQAEHHQNIAAAHHIIIKAYDEKYKDEALRLFSSPSRSSHKFTDSFLQSVLDAASEHLRCAKTPVPLTDLQTAFLKTIHRKCLRSGILSFKVTEQDFLQECSLNILETFKELLRCLFGTIILVDRNSNVNICFHAVPPKLVLQSDRPPKQSKSTDPPPEPRAKKARQDPPLLTAMRQWDKRTDKGAQDDAMLLELTNQPSHLANEPGLHLETPLHLAAARGHTRLVETLLEAGAFPDVADKQLNTPLHYATAAGHLECAKLLLRYGADASIRNRAGLRPIHYATYKFATCLRNAKPPSFPLQILRNTLGDRIADHTAQRLLLTCRSLRRDALICLTRVWLPGTSGGDGDEFGSVEQLLTRYPAAATVGYNTPFTAVDTILLQSHPRLKALHLNICHAEDIQEPFRTVLAHLTQLTSLHLTGNTPINSDTVVLLPPTLRTLSLSNLGTFSSSLFSSEVHPFQHLHTMTLHKLSISTPDVALLCTHAPHLTRLTVARCQQLDCMVPFFFISSLQHLSIKQCPKVQQTNWESVLMAVVLITRHEALDVRARFDELNAAGRSLKTLHLRGLKRPLRIPVLLKYIPNLQKLAIEDVEFPSAVSTDDTPTHGLQHLTALTSLTYLSFAGASLKIHLINHLTSLHHLATLDLRACSLPPRIIPQLALLPSLTALNLAHWDVKKRLVPEAAKQLSTLTQLQHLGLAKRRVADAGETKVAPEGLGVKSRRLWCVKVVRRALVRTLAQMGGLQGVDLWRWNDQERAHFQQECGGGVKVERWRRPKVLHEEPAEGAIG